jgi:hypothetical protein
MHPEAAPQYVPAHVWAKPAMLAACERQEFAAILGLARKYIGASYNQISRCTGIAPTEISAIINGCQRVEKVNRIIAIATGLAMLDEARRRRTAQTRRAGSASTPATSPPRSGSGWPRYAPPTPPGTRPSARTSLGITSGQAKDLGLHGEAIRLAEAARSGYPGASPRVSAILHMRAAHAGDANESRAEMDPRPERLEHPHPGDRRPALVLLVGRSADGRAGGLLPSRIDDWGRAQAHLRNALASQPAEPGREHALRLALLANTYARQGDPEQACQFAHRSVDLHGRIALNRSPHRAATGQNIITLEKENHTYVCYC